MLAATDVWLIKTDAAGNMQWNKTYGGTGTDWMDRMIQNCDGGYAIAGFTTSFGAGCKMFGWLRLMLLATCSGTRPTEEQATIRDGGSLIQTADGGYAIIGSTTSFGAGGNDAWLIKTDCIWQHAVEQDLRRNRH